MPTAARLVAAVFLAGLAALAFYVAIGHAPKDVSPRSFVAIGALIGAFCGWTILGPRAGHGYVPSISHGMTAMASMVLLSLGAFGALEMWRLALRRRYDGVMEALAGLLEEGYEYALWLANGPTLALLLGGSILAGVLAEQAARRWR